MSSQKISQLAAKTTPATADYTVIVDVAGGGVNKRTTLAQILSLVQALPAGGSIGQILTKLSGTDGDADWQDPAPAGVWGSISGNILDQADLVAELMTLSDAIDAVVSDVAYNATSWNAVVDVAPSKNAVRDQIETMLTSIATKVDSAAVTAAIAAALAVYRKVSTFSGTGVTPGAGTMDETFVYTGSSAQVFTGWGALSGLPAGYKATIQGSDDTNTITVPENDVSNGWIMDGPAELTNGRSISFELNSGKTRMVENSRTF